MDWPNAPWEREYFMKRFLFFFAVLASSVNSYAALITNTIEFNNKLPAYTEFVFDMKEQGFNPATDRITWFNYSFDVKEIVEDPFGDDEDWQMDLWEFAIIYDRFLFYRGIFADMDTGVQNWSHNWTPYYGCHSSIETDQGDVCVFQPDLDGIFYSTWGVYTDNLWLNSISFTIDYTRKEVDEPSSMLLLTMLLFIALFRSNYFLKQ